MKSVDARGYSCPEPVLRARRALQELPAGAELEVLVDTVTSRENVFRTARSLGCEPEAGEHEGGWRVVVRKP